MSDKDAADRKQRDAQRKREYRAKQSAIAGGTYKPSAIDEAKQYLDSMDDP